MITLTQPLKTRIAPSPTGHLHLGHVLHIIYVCGIAKKLGAAVNLRLEDHDQGRCRPEFEASILEDLEWLGVELPTEVWRQSDRAQVYQNHLEKLMKLGLVYACRCSRKDVQETLGQGSGELIYPGTCRKKNYPLDSEGSSLRLKLDQMDISAAGATQLKQPEFYDLLWGKIGAKTYRPVGDVVIKDRHGHWTYQFTVVIDDLEQDINLIIRGEDLQSSTFTQLAMRKILAPEASVPIFAHHPLIFGEDGQKLAKRKSSESVSYLRRMGLSADEVRGLAAYAGGLIDTRRTIGKLDNLDFKLNLGQ
jgi:glutamyl-tRNA synthetase/glutamyl-Q tRNA(Asp) synthetase